MDLPCWHVLAWERVDLSTARFGRIVRHMRCLGVSVRDDPAQPDKQRGEVLWAADVEGLRLGLAWEWGEVCQGVVALVDPLTILSNARLVSDDGAPVGTDDLWLHLNGVVNALRWQPAVRRSARQQPLAVSRRDYKRL